MTDSEPTPSATIHEAATAGDVATLTVMLARDPASIDAPGADGWTPLHLAAHYGRADAVRLLLEHGASVHVVSANATANTPLHASLAGAGDAATAELLLVRGADANARGGGGWTPLHLAASRGSDALVRRLLDAGADASTRSDDGRDAAAIATERGHRGVAALLATR